GFADGCGVLIASRGLCVAPVAVSADAGRSKIGRVRDSTLPLRVVVGRVSVPVDAGLREPRILVRGAAVVMRGGHPVDIAAPVRVRLSQTTNRVHASVHVVLLICSCRCGGSRSMTAFSCWWRAA